MPTNVSMPLQTNKDRLRIEVQIGTIRFDLMIHADTVLSAPSEKHNHSAYEVHYFVSGSGTLYVDSEELTVSAGSILLIGPGVYHSFRVQADDPVSRFFIRFTFTQTDESKSREQQQEDRQIVGILSQVTHMLYTDPAFDETVRLIKSIYRELDTQLTGYYAQIQTLFVQLLIRLIRSLSLRRSDFTIPVRISDEMRTLMIDHFFDRYREHLTIDDLARQLHLSRRQTNRILLQYYQMSFKQKQRNTRIQVAMELLLTNELTLEQIAERVGYPSVFPFCKAFKQTTSETPTKYRSRMEQG
ncbi:AraC family transcriptional regulator [Paenibacillus koleovorans]|uniref:AraC family transcriptional regulator n=1 Tax=Paenibacillus koleovorans TaxID=121608 RepID=UPI000FD7A443|nr:AraC family transcriptional regulator [Paenibacillus koleovorans]